MNKYEIVTIIDAAIPQEEKEIVIKDVGEAINKCEGKVIKSQIWLDKHKFSFNMNKRTEGTYYTTNCEMPCPSVAKLRTALKLNDKVLRSLIVKVD